MNIYLTGDRKLKKKKSLAYGATNIGNHTKCNITLKNYWNYEQKRLNELNREQWDSSWLATIPLSEEGYDVTKQFFWDLLRIRLVGHSQDSSCECGIKFDI